jgi:WD40 repeat protein
MTDSLKGNALVIGINDYSGGVKPLQSAVTDARAIADSLRDQHGYEVELLLDSEATASAIFRLLEADCPKRLDPESAFLLYFAGHGVARGDGSAGPQGYLLASDAALGVQSSWLPMDRLRKALEALPSRHLLVILDCCFAGSFRWASTRDVLLEARPLYDSQYLRYLKGTAWQALTSASHNEAALDVSPGDSNTRDPETATGSHSPFARALLRGLAGEADSSRGKHAPDGVITATELFQFAFEEFSSTDPPPLQTPGIWPLRPDNTGEYIFRNPRLPKNTLPDPPLDEANNPWMGLRAYASDDAPLLFGRERCIAEIIDRIVDRDRPCLVAVIGASGTGKSSVVKAGVLPRLEQPSPAHDSPTGEIGPWTVVRSDRLAGDPGRSLARAVAELEAADGRRLLFIDQFEELYTQCRDPELRQRYLDRIRQLLDRSITVVLTLRSDFEPQPARSGALADLWSDARVVVPAFSGEEFRQCIEGPAALKALYFEPQALVGELVDEVMAMPGALPMLSFALAEMYRRAQLRRRATGSNDRALTGEDYQATGGVVGALHRRASALFDAGTPQLQATIERVFLRMIAQDGARLTRRRISLTELEFAEPDEQARVARVTKDFVDARLLVIDADTIEPAHDTLVVAWDKLLECLSAAGPQDLIRAVWRAALDWHEGGGAAGMTWHDDPRLPLALSKRDQLNRLEQQFVDASEATRKRRINRTIALASIVGLAILGSALVAWQQRNHAVAQEQIALEQEAQAELQRDRALASALLANAQAQTDPVIQGLTVAEIHARGLPPPARAAEVARQAFERLGEVEEHRFGNGTGWDMRRVTGADHISFQTLLGDRVDDSWSFEPIHFRNRPHQGRLIENAFTSNDRSVYASYADGVTVYWPDPLNSELAVRIAEPVAGLAADASGTRLAIAVGEQLRVLDIDPASGDVAARVLGRHDVEIAGIALTPDAQWAATGSADGEVRVWNVASGDVLHRQRLPSAVSSVALGRDGENLAAGMTDGTIRLWRGPAGERVEQSGRCDGAVEMLSLSPGQQVLGGVCAGRAWVWNTADLSLAAAYPSDSLRRVKFVLWPDSFYPGGPWPGAFAHDGLWLIGLGVPQPPVAWPVVTAAASTAFRPVPPSAPVAEQELVPDGEFVAAERIGAKRLLGFRVIESAEGPFEVHTVLRDLETGTALSDWSEFPWGLEPDRLVVHVDPSGSHALAIATDGIFWLGVLFDLGADADPSNVVGRIDGSLLREVVFSPDGARLLVLNDRMNPNIIHADPQLFDTSNLAELRALGGQRFVAQAVFSSDSSRLATIDCYGETRLWNADGSGDPVVFDPRDDSSRYLCGESEGIYDESLLPRVAFSDDGELLSIRRPDTPPATHIVGLATLSEQIRGRVFACLSAAQREQFLAETVAQAEAGYRTCLDRLMGRAGAN